MSHMHRAECRGDCRTTADVTCKLCFRPEGRSGFVRVGKYKVRHQDCAAAWTEAELEQGREQLFLFQIEKTELAMMEALGKEDSLAILGNYAKKVDPLSPEYLDFKKAQLGGTHGEDQAAS